MISPSIRAENIPQASTRTRPPFSRRAVRIVSGAVALVVNAAPRAADEPERLAQSAASSGLVGVAGHSLRQTGMSAPTRRRSSACRRRSTSFARICCTSARGGLAGRWKQRARCSSFSACWSASAGYRPMRSSESSRAKLGSVQPRPGPLTPWSLIPQPSALPAEYGVPPHPLPRLFSPPAGGDAGPAPGSGGPNGSPAQPRASNGHRARHGSVNEPGPGSDSVLRQRRDRSTPGLGPVGEHAELQRCEDVAADCTEAIRLAPDDLRLYPERGNALSGLRRYEAAVADCDRAILLDPDNAAAYLARCRARSELGLHAGALEDFERLASLDPEVADMAAGL